MTAGGRTMPQSSSAGVDDGVFMDLALRLAARGLGRVWPNPAVGCVIVDPATGRVLGRGWTQPGGRPHAETEALARAGAQARGATAYVSLEPCAHHGQTPPCADALVAAGVGRVVVALEDPDPRVSGGGLTRLRAAGIAVTTGVGSDAARDLNRGFLRRVTTGLPMVTLKLATTMDGRIATASGDSQWITGSRARERGHLLRASHDAILIGRGTAAADDPALSCRLDGLGGSSPVRVVLDGGLGLGIDSILVRSARDIPTWVITDTAAPADRAEGLQRLGVEVIRVRAGRHGGVDAGDALRALGSRGITRVLAEGGSRVAASLLADRLVDRIVWFRAALMVGGDGRAAVDELGVVTLADAVRLHRRDTMAVGADVMETYELDS